MLALTHVTITSKMIDQFSYYMPLQSCQNEAIVSYNCCFVLLICLLKSKQKYIKTNQNVESDKDDNEPVDHFLVKWLK